MSEAKLKVRHIGTHAKRADTMTGTGTVWRGFGDVQEVPAKDWETLKKYPDLWELVLPEDDEEDDAGQPVGPTLGDAITLPDGFDAWSDEQVREWLVDKPFKVHHKKTGDGLKAAVREALGV